jgi:hypothetical protein
MTPTMSTSTTLRHSVLSKVAQGTRAFERLAEPPPGRTRSTPGRPTSTQVPSRLTCSCTVTSAFRSVSCEYVHHPWADADARGADRFRRDDVIVDVDRRIAGGRIIEQDSVLDREKRFEDYARARLWVHDVRNRTLEVRPTATGTSGPFPFDAPAVHVITAYNPGPERLDAEENERRQRALVAELPDTTSTWTVEAGAADGSHREVSVLIVGLNDEDAIAIAVRWGQDAIFRWTRDALSIVPCDGATPIVTGWSVVEQSRETTPRSEGMPVLGGEQFDPDDYMARAIERAVPGAEAAMARHHGRLLGTERWVDEHGHWLRLRVELDSRPGVEIQYARVLLPASGPDMSPETEAAVYGSGFEERLHLRAPGIEPVDGVITL